MERLLSPIKLAAGLIAIFAIALAFSAVSPSSSVAAVAVSINASSTPKIKPPVKKAPPKPKNPAPAQPAKPSQPVIVPILNSLLNFTSVLSAALKAAGISLPNGGNIIPPQAGGLGSGLGNFSGLSGGGSSGAGGGGGGGSTFGGKIEQLVDCKAPAGAKWFMVVGPVAGPEIWMPGTPVATPSDGKNTLGNNGGQGICVVSEHDHRPGKIVTLIGVSQ